MDDFQLPPPDDRSFLNRKRQGDYFLLIVLLVAIFGVFWILRPFLNAILIAAVSATVCAPVYLALEKKLKGRKSIAAALTCAMATLIILGPVGGFAYTLVDMGVERFEQVGTWVEEGNLQELPKNEKVKKFLEWKPVRFLADRLDRMDLSELQQSVEKLGDGAGTLPGDPDANAPPAGDLDANAPPMAAVGDLFHIDKLQEIALWAVSAVVNALHEQLLPLLANVGSLLFNFIIILFVMFYFLREGENVVKFLMRVSPLPDAYERRLFERARTIVSSAVVGTGLTSLAQGVLGMIAFAVVGIPWFFYGVLMMMTSLVPLIGTALVWLPCVVYLLIIGATGKAIGLAIWCAVVVGSADNFLRPFFMKGDTGLSSGLLFFAIIGGVQVFGLMGVVYGPLIFGSCAILLHVYQLEMDREEQLASACEVAPQVLPEGTPDP